MTLNAVNQCESNQFDFSRVFRNQFVLSERTDIKTPGWATKTVSSWHFQHCTDLPVSEIRAKDGSVIGFVIGVAVDSEGTRVNAPKILNQNLVMPGSGMRLTLTVLALPGDTSS